MLKNVETIPAGGTFNSSQTSRVYGGRRNNIDGVDAMSMAALTSITSTIGGFQCDGGGGGGGFGHTSGCGGGGGGGFWIGRVMLLLFFST